MVRQGYDSRTSWPDVRAAIMYDVVERLERSVTWVGSDVGQLQLNGERNLHSTRWLLADVLRTVVELVDEVDRHYQGLNYISDDEFYAESARLDLITTACARHGN